MSMNAAEIDGAAAACQGHPVLGPATRFLQILKNNTNAQSDGWCYWPAPSKASEKLQEFIRLNTGAWYRPSSMSDRATKKELLKTITPIKRMVAAQKKIQAERGNKYDFDVDEALRRCGLAKPLPTVNSAGTTLDPNAAWKELSAAVQAGDLNAAMEYAQSLRGWLIGGGFPPVITGRVDFDRVVAKLVCDEYYV